jgi:ribosomal protein S6--L-glutamate ligase
MRIAFVHNIPNKIYDKVVKPIAAALAANGSQVDVLPVSSLYVTTENGQTQIWDFDGSQVVCDAVLARIVSAPQFISFLYAFSNLKTPVVNNPEALGILPDKFVVQSKLEAAGIPATPTMTLMPGGQWVNTLWNKYQGEVVVKPNRGMKGDGVEKFDSLQGLTTHSQEQEIKNLWLGQPLIKSVIPGDVRVFIAGGEVIAAMQRIPAENQWKTNLHKGGKGIPYSLTPLERQISVNSARVCGLDIAGVDLLITEDGPLVLEVNPNPGIQIGDVTGVDVCTAIAQVVYSKM